MTSHVFVFQFELCNQPLRDLSDSSDISSLHYVSPDDEFSIQAIKQHMTQKLLKLLPEYSKVCYVCLKCMYMYMKIHVPSICACTC